jgi:deubiquitinase DESI2
MKLKCKKGRKSIEPLHLKGKSPVTCLSLFRKVNSASHGPGKTPVYLNVYDFTPMNGYMYWVGLGIYHSGVEGMVLGS